MLKEKDSGKIEKDYKQNRKHVIKNCIEGMGKTKTCVKIMEMLCHLYLGETVRKNKIH